MKKFVFFFLAIGLLIPLFAVPTSAASYDLGTPFELHYTTPSGANESTWPFAYNGYIYDSSSDSLVFRSTSLGERNYFAYFKNSSEFSVDNPIFKIGNDIPNSSLSRYITVTGYDSLSTTILYENSGNLVNSLVFASFVYENLYLPSTGQYLQVSFSVDTALIQVPTSVFDFLNLNTLCFLCDTSGRSGYPDRYSLPKVYPSTSTVKKDGNIFTYTFFFNINYTHLESLYDSENICLALRIPYYFNSAASFSGGCGVVSNASIPLSYDILTVGGYDRALSDIQNSIDSLKTDLVDFYTDQSSADIGYISRGQSINTQVTNSIGEYNDALKPLDSLRNDYTAPPAAQQVQQQLSNMETEEVKKLFSVPWIVSALGLVFTFSLIRLILYGTKEG